MLTALRWIFILAVALGVTGLMQGTEFPLFSSNFLFPKELQGKWRLSSILCDGKESGFSEVLQDGAVEIDWAVTGTSTRSEERIGTCVKQTQMEKPLLSTSRLVQVLVGRTECNRDCRSVSRESCNEGPVVERLAYDFNGDQMRVRKELPSRYCERANQVATYVFDKVL